ncbi:MAG: NGG1p interacting factor NIF3 [Spirochaetes bacterium]|jgi:hypothetical protein|nr:NGG1p interacting factor NIF3 [Spirochaetota bacterium]
MYILVVYVPVSHSSLLKQKLFTIEAGKYGKYDSCSFETFGTGSFRPLKGSKPFVGSPGSVETVEELRIEMIFHDTLKDDVRKCIKDNHPYEEPAYHFIRVEV